MAALPRARPAHAPGPTFLAYSRNGRKLVTAGTNDALRIFQSGSDGEPTTVDGASESNLAVVSTNDFFITGSEDGRVCKFSHESNLFDTVLVRSTLPIRHLALSPDGEWVAVASDELVVKVVNTSNSERLHYLREQSKPVKHVSYDPTGAFLAASCTDGNIYIYDMTTDQPHLVHRVDGLIPAVDMESDTRTEAVWHPDGRAFAVATQTREVQIVSVKDWAMQKTFKGGHNSDITAMAWSPNGALLVTAGRDQKICLWSTRAQTRLQTVDCGCTVLACEWHPTENILSYTNSEGELYMHEGFVEPRGQSYLSSRLQPAPFIHEPLSEVSGNAARQPVDNAKRNPIPQRPTRAETPDSLDEMLASVAGSEDGFVDDDDGAGYAPQQYEGYGKRPREDGTVDFPNKRQRSYKPELHESFQPGSTPWRGDRKYLCLNLIGLVWTIGYEQYCTVTVEYYDHSFQRDFHFTDPYFFEEACLSEKGVLLASHRRSNSPASIFFRPHEHWTTERPDWRIFLPEGEDVVAIGLSDSFVVVSTTADYLRVYTLFGTPFRVIRLKSSPTVTCASWRDYVMTIGNGAAGADGRTRLLYTIFNIKRDEVLQSEDVVALPSDAKLRNAFFSDKGDPHIFDTTGTLLALAHWRTPGQAQWIPMLDTKRLDRIVSGRRDENYWPVAVANGRFHCCILKGGEMHPSFPRPLLSDFDFEIPIASSVTKQNSEEEQTDAEKKLKDLEQTFVKDTVLSSQHLDLLESTHSTSSQRAEQSRQRLELDKTLLQMVWESCVGQDERQGMKALELVGLMKDTSGKMIDGASKIASRFGLDVLRQKIAELAESRLMGEGDE